MTGLGPSHRRAEDHPAVPVRWASLGWTVRQRGPILFVHTPTGRAAGDVLRRYDGRWSVAGNRGRGVRFTRVCESAMDGVNVLCHWWTEQEAATDRGTE